MRAGKGWLVGNNITELIKMRETTAINYITNMYHIYGSATTTANPITPLSAATLYSLVPSCFHADAAHAADDHDDDGGGGDDTTICCGERTTPPPPPPPPSGDMMNSPVNAQENEFSTRANKNENN